MLSLNGLAFAMPAIFFFMGAIAAPTTLQPRDGVVHVSKFDCREYNAGNAKTSLCATQAERAFPDKAKCAALGKLWSGAGNQVLKSDWEVKGFAGDDDCGFNAFNLNGPKSAGGLTAYTWDAATMGAFITEQTEACFYQNSPFNYFHCTLPAGALLFVGSNNAA